MRIFVAGASGVIGYQLLPMLVAAGHEVVGLTRHPERATVLEQQRAAAAVADATDRDALVQAVVRAAPQVVIHQLTDLAAAVEAGYTPQVLAANARLRALGTANLVAAAERSGAGRLVAQSGAWLYAPGPEPHDEDDALGPGDDDGTTLEGIRALERMVLGSDRFEGLVLRYGLLYGPGTGSEAPDGGPNVSVAGAARAALLAVDGGTPGIYNIVDDGGPVSNAKAKRELGWSP